MPSIKITITVDAPQERVFDLSRSIDLHKQSTGQTKEEAIAGVTSGLIDLGESVTWRATHFGIRQTLTSKITEYKRPHYFVDEMVSGAFESFHHEHRFEKINGMTIMTDVFNFTSPYGLLGKVADAIFLKNYMRKFLHTRNIIIKEFAESDRWNEIPGIF